MYKGIRDRDSLKVRAIFKIFSWHLNLKSQKKKTHESVPTGFNILFCYYNPLHKNSQNTDFPHNTCFFFPLVFLSVALSLKLNGSRQIHLFRRQQEEIKFYQKSPNLHSSYLCRFNVHHTKYKPNVMLLLNTREKSIFTSQLKVCSRVVCTRCSARWRGEFYPQAWNSAPS